MKKIALLTLFAIFTLSLSAFANRRDTSGRDTSALDTLHQQLKQAANDSLKARIYTQLASQFLNYDTISNAKTKLYYQNQALSYTLLSLHGYSKYNDSVGLRIAFNDLSKVYRSQKKFIQAKWFIIQSNSISREKNDVPNIISSLNELAQIKMEIKDYSLAMRDLNEALKLSALNHYPKAESIVQQNYALLYSRMKDYTKEAIAIKRHNFIEDSIRRAELAQLTAKLNAQDTAQSKKKLHLISYKHTSKTNSAKRIVSI